MDQKARDIMQAQWGKLPDEIRTAILAADLPEKLRVMARGHDLRVDEAGVVENETMLVLLGLEHPSEYVDNLQKALGLPREKVEGVAREINENVFAPIHEAIISLHKQSVAAPLESNIPAAVIDVPPERTAAPILGTDIAETKLAGSVHLPSDTIKIKEPVLQTAIQKPPSPVQNGIYTKGIDPYREPTN